MNHIPWHAIKCATNEEYIKEAGVGAGLGKLFSGLKFLGKGLLPFLIFSDISDIWNFATSDVGYIPDIIAGKPYKPNNLYIV